MFVFCLFLGTLQLGCTPTSELTVNEASQQNEGGCSIFDQTFSVIHDDEPDIEDDKPLCVAETKGVIDCPRPIESAQAIKNELRAAIEMAENAGEDFVNPEYLKQVTTRIETFTGAALSPTLNVELDARLQRLARKILIRKDTLHSDVNIKFFENDLDFGTGYISNQGSWTTGNFKYLFEQRVVCSPTNNLELSLTPSVDQALEIKNKGFALFIWFIDRLKQICQETK